MSDDKPADKPADRSGDKPRDWDKELADIDRAIARMPAAPAPQDAPAPAPRAAPARPVSPAVPPDVGAPATRRGIAVAWMKTLIAAGLILVVIFWPYAVTCGRAVALYLGAVALVLGASVWAAIASWRHRRAIAHVVALLVLLGGLALAMRQILPRVGYAQRVATWTCGG